MYEKNKQFSDISLIKHQTKVSLSCFYQSFIPCYGKMCDYDLTLRDHCFASYGAKVLSEGVTNIQLRKWLKIALGTAA